MGIIFTKKHIILLHQPITIYTDGSCHTQLLIGAWVAILFMDNEKITLSGIENNTTHNRMELTAIIKALEHLEQRSITTAQITVITDSQYAVGLQTRQQKFTANNYTTKKGSEISNADLVKILLAYTNTTPVNFIKIKAHQKVTAVANYNIEADKLSRNLVRQAIK